MSPPTNAEANAAAIAAQTALTNAANAVFISNAATVINNAAGRGKFRAILFANPNVSLAYVDNYFKSLGYQVWISSCPSARLSNPSNLFGENWIRWWNDLSGFINFWRVQRICRCTESCRVSLRWYVNSTLPTIPSYLVLEDGISRFELEDGSGDILLE